MLLADLSHYVGGDLSSTSSGDLVTVTTTIRGQQRILRRLMTNPGELPFHPDYGAGLPAWIGRLAEIPALTALIRGQVLLEDAVSRKPEPVISIVPIPNTAGGGFSVSIAYTDAPTGQPATLSFNVNR